ATGAVRFDRALAQARKRTGTELSAGVAELPRSVEDGRGGRDTEATSEPEGSTGNHRGEHRSLFSPSGIPIKSTMDNPTTTQYANLMHNFILKARSTVREIDPQNDLTFLRIRSKKNEIMVAPGFLRLGSKSEVPVSSWLKFLQKR
uniref:Microtubule associated protein 1 light chain 3 alpha n=1 Tax=Suricata suricatta TaxID=37032 RepID=A0A673TEU2_SURSU